MLVPITFEEAKEEVFPVVVRQKIDEITTEKDLSRLRAMIIDLSATDPCEALRVTNMVSRVIGHPL